jgi:mycothiol system anti-sigma-R factor
MMDECDEPDCAATLKELDVFLDNELSVDVRLSISHHLEGCPDCHGAFDFHAELKMVIGEKCRNEEMPPDLLARIERCFSTDIDGDGRVG